MKKPETEGELLFPKKVAKKGSLDYSGLPFAKPVSKKKKKWGKKSG